MSAKLAHRHNRHIINLHVTFSIDKSRFAVLFNQMLVGVIYGK